MKLSRAILSSFMVVSAIPVIAREPLTLDIPKERIADATAIWDYEQTIYERRAVGDMGYYVSLTSPDYMAWPAPARMPMGFDKLETQAKGASSTLAGEVIQVTETGMSFDGDTALSFFQTHRTRRAGGGEVDEKFDNIHVWVKRDGGWRLLAGMSRPVIENPAALAGPLVR